MKSTIFTLIRLTGLAVASLTLVAHSQERRIFKDNFSPRASRLWRNEVGAWSAAGGVYKATAPANFPAASSSLPFSLRDFSVDFDVNDVQDGGIWLRSTAEPGTAVGRKGILFNLQTINGSKVYWHIVSDGSQWGDAQNLTYLSYGNNVHVHIKVVGETYSAFLDGSSTPASTLTTSLFAKGRVALYDFSGQSFDNFVLRVATRHAATEKTDLPSRADPIIYVANSGNNTIVKFVSGISSVFASTGLSQPQGLAFDTSGNLYAANFGNDTIEKFTPGGVGSVFASTGVSGPTGLAFDVAGNLFVANQSNGTIEKFTPGGVGSVFATGLSSPTGLAFDTAGNLYTTAGPGNIFKFTPGGVGSTFASGLGQPTFLAFDSVGNLFVGEYSNSDIVKFTPGGAGSVFANTGLSYPYGEVFDSAGNLYVANVFGNTVEKFTPDGVGSVFANTGLSAPTGIAIVPEPSTSALTLRHAATRHTATGTTRLPNGSRRTFENPSPTQAPAPRPLDNLSSAVTLEGPTLSIQSGVVVSWPAAFTGYVLEQNTNSTTTNWDRVTNPVSVVNQVIVPTPSGNRFYRLRAP